ncbi:MAG: Na+-translocating ferredoxin:NAD+ oxidoreductase RnfG subunit [Candidatus Binatia bacterium]|jgi:Na+-translocating ferredoxin:NAD+ oxidoreductase RnfG subunit
MKATSPASTAKRCASATAVAIFALLAIIAPAGADEVFLAEDEAPGAVFPKADRFERHDVATNENLRARIAEALGRAKPTVLEPSYPLFEAWKNDELLGRAIIVQEIGKHRPITFIVGVEPDGDIAGVSVMVYREAYGGEVRSGRFLTQYRGKDSRAPLLPGADIRNITGATLSVQAIGRGVKKAIAVAALANHSHDHSQEDGIAEAGG